MTIAPVVFDVALDETPPATADMAIDFLSTFVNASIVISPQFYESTALAIDCYLDVMNQGLIQNVHEYFQALK